MNIGGAPTVVYEQLKKINKEKFKPYLLTLYPSKKANFFAKLEEILPSENIAGFNLRNRSIFDLRTLFKIYKFLKRERFDVVYTHLFLANFIVRGLAVLSGVPHILAFEHSAYFNKSKWQIFSDKILAFFTDKIIVSTKAVAEFTANQESISKDKFEVILNPFSVPSKESVCSKSLKKEAGLPENCFVAMSLGRFSKEKGQIYFIEAAERVIKENNNIYFILVGHGPLENELKREVETRELEERFRIVVMPERAKEFFHIADLFVLPSLREGQSITLYEALCAPLPVIASNLESIKDIIMDGFNGVLVKAGNSKAIYEKIIYFYNNPDERNKFRQNALESIKTIERCGGIKKFEDLIEKIINSVKII